MLQEMGSQIKMTRLRCNITSLEMAQCTSLDRNIIVKIEAGDESVVVGSYFSVWIAKILSRHNTIDMGTCECMVTGMAINYKRINNND